MALGGPVKLPPDFDLQSPNAGSEWKFWQTAFQDYLVATGQDNALPSVKLSILRNIIGHDSAKIMATFETPQNVDQYQSMLVEIGKYVNPRKNECFERYMFSRRIQKEGESFDHFLTDCRHLIKTCNYNTVDPDQSQEDKALRDRIVTGIRDPTTREALLRMDDLNVNKAIHFCRTSEQSKSQSLQFQEAGAEINIVKKKSKYEKFQRLPKSPRYDHRSDDPEQKFKCKRCQTVHGPRKCPAYGRKCGKCGIENHFAVSCRIKNIRNVKQGDASGSDSDELSVNRVEEDKYVDQKVRDDFCEKLTIEEKKFKVRLDTGADCCVMPLSIFRKINKQFKVRPTRCILKGFEGSQAKPLGIVNLHVSFKDREIYEDFVIIDGANQILVGGQACLKLKLIKRINNVNLLDSNLSEKNEFIEKHKEIFTGFGRFPGKHNIPTKHNFENVCYPPSKIPIAVRDQLKIELDRLVERKAIVKVDEIKPEASINRIVIVEKSSGKIRLCLDPSDINCQIVRKPRLGVNIEEVCSNLRGNNYFTVFDLSEGYHHIELNDESSWKCCFATPFGVYRFIVLPYGLSNSQDIFQEEVEKHFSDLQNVIIVHDDMILYGQTKQEHDLAVAEVVKRAKEVGARFNKDKLQYCQSQVKFMGQIFSQLGMQIDPDRVESLCKLKAPTTKVELQRVIGSFNYVRRYVKNMSDLMHPLCQLLKNNVEWSWLPEHQQAFVRLKEVVTKTPALVPFDPLKQTVLQCDASKNGLGCCMFQKYENNVLKLVACASRSMNDHEVNYSQTEKELLAIFFSTQKFHDFIYRQIVDVQTDHKPIISIMKKPIQKIGSVRLQRFRLKLLKYSLNVYYVPGKNVQFADMLSRSSLQLKTHPDPDMFQMVHLVSKHLPMSQNKKDEFRLKTSEDSTLSKIHEFYYNGWPKAQQIPSDCKPYYPLKDSIYVEAGLIFVEDKIIVPQVLRTEMIKLVHKGHIGISKSINKARTLFYWPNLPSDITNYIRSCRICEKYSPANHKEPLMPHSVPKLRFNKVAVDIVEFAGKNYLVLIDHFSHWLELVSLKDKTSKSVIDCFQDIFTRFGYPEIIVGDNLPFVSSHCRKYYKSKDITITTCSPHYHQSNGMAEKAVSIAKQILRKSFEDKCDFREYILEYNNSPVISLGATPAQILQSRILKTELPITFKKLEPKIERKIYDKLHKQKQIMKSNFDKSARRNPLEYRKGDKVVIKTSKEKIWQKAIVIEKASEPRSYWVRKEGNNKIVRRNTAHMKLSSSKSDHKFICEPELYPNEYPSNSHSDDVHPNNIYPNNSHSNIQPNNSCSSQNTNALNTPVSSPQRSTFCSTPDFTGFPIIPSNVTVELNGESSECMRSRYGRRVKAPQRLDL